LRFFILQIAIFIFYFFCFVRYVFGTHYLHFNLVKKVFLSGFLGMTYLPVALGLTYLSFKYYIKSHQFSNNLKDIMDGIPKLPGHIKNFINDENVQHWWHKFKQLIPSIKDAVHDASHHKAAKVD